MGLFEGVSFYISEKNVKDAAEIKSVLVKGGGSREFYPSELVSHVISDTLPPPSLGLSRCSESVILHSDWVYMSSRCGVLLPTTPFCLRGDKLLSGLVFCPSKLSRSDQEKLACLVLYYGGKLQLRLDSNVTHLITMDTSTSKYDAAVRHGVKVVTPDWMIDTIEIGSLVNEYDYGPLEKGRGDHTHQSPRPQCNGAISENREVSGSVGVEEEEEREVAMEIDDGERQQPDSISEAVPSVLEKEDEEREERRENGEVTNSKDNDSRKLLTGLMFHLTGYLECMEPETLSKWKDVIIQHGGGVADQYDPAHCTHLLALHKKNDIFAKAYTDGKCIASAHWLNDILTEGKMFPPRCALHYPTAFKWQVPGADKYSITLTNYTGRERDLVKDIIHLTGITYTGHLARDTTYLVCKSASGKKYEKAMEWGVTVVNTSFLADIIHNGQVPAVLFPRHTHIGQPQEFLSTHCFEACRLLRPWEQFIEHYKEVNVNCFDSVTTELVLQSIQRRERKISDELGGVAKKTKFEREAGPPVILLTGISQSIARKLREVVQSLGGGVSERPSDCTHLVAPRVARTVKFLSGISVCSWVLTPDWIEECEKEGRFVNEKGFTLRDTDAETMFSMDIQSSLSRARSSKFLQGCCVHATFTVQPSSDSLREIVECAGGRLVTSGEAQAMFGRKFERLGQSDGKLLILSTPEDLNSGLCTLFTSHGIPIYNAELVLTGALRQQLDLSQSLLFPSTVSGGGQLNNSCSSNFSDPSNNEE